MAITYIGATNTNPGSTSSTNITLPVGTAAGDIAVLFLGWAGHQNETFDTSNFTEIIGRSAPFARPNVDYQYVQSGYRTITAGDITNGYIAISSDGSFSAADTVACMAVFRDGVASPTAANAASSGTGPSYANTITPSANSIIFLWEFAAGFSNNSQSASSQAIATDNPTWAEIQDYTTTSGDDLQQSVAYAIRPEATATGNSSMTMAYSSVSWAMLVSFAPVVSVTVSPSVVTMTLSVQAPSVSGAANVSPTVITTTISVQAPTITTANSKVTNKNKNSASTIVNKDKS